MIQRTEFDVVANHYEAALDRGISVSGETKDYFAKARIVWLAKQLNQLNRVPGAILDYGCGIGSAAPFFNQCFPLAQFLGLDTSSRSLQEARRLNCDRRSTFLNCVDYQPVGIIDLAFCNGVFHHILPEHRPGTIDYIHRSLRPGGLFAFWENNPWNPGTRYVMSRIPFDSDAITLSALEAQRLLKDTGFEILRTDFLFIFPRAFRFLRVLEPYLVRLPFGAQYQVLCRKP